MISKVVDIQYQKILVDNAICKRRFHIVYESGGKNESKTEVLCPHCGVTVFSQVNHPHAMLTREENLVKNPDGLEPIIYECQFKS